MTEVTYDLRKVDPSARIQVRRAGELISPAQCTVCGFGGVEREYVDFSVWFEYEGQIYFCTLCMEEAAHALQMSTAEEFAHLRGLYEKTQSKLKAQEEELNVLRELHDTLSRLNLLGNASVTADGTDEGNEPEQPAEPDADANVHEPSGDGTEPSPVLTESGKSTGPNDPSRTPVRNRNGKSDGKLNI